MDEAGRLSVVDMLGNVVHAAVDLPGHPQAAHVRRPLFVLRQG